jgi:Putative restriction endonuclease
MIDLIALAAPFPPGNPGVSMTPITAGITRKDCGNEAYGLLECWIVDPLQYHVTVLTRLGDAWNESDFRTEQVIVSLVLPGLATTVAELFVDAEEDDDNPTDPDANAT